MKFMGSILLLINSINLVKLKEINLDYEIPCNNVSKYLNKQGLIKN